MAGDRGRQGIGLGNEKREAATAPVFRGPSEEAEAGSRGGDTPRGHTLHTESQA